MAPGAVLLIAGAAGGIAFLIRELAALDDDLEARGDVVVEVYPDSGAANKARTQLATHGISAAILENNSMRAWFGFPRDVSLVC